MIQISSTSKEKTFKLYQCPNVFRILGRIRWDLVPRDLNIYQTRAKTASFFIAWYSRTLTTILLELVLESHRVVNGRIWADSNLSCSTLQDSCARASFRRHLLAVYFLHCSLFRARASRLCLRYWWMLLVMTVVVVLVVPGQELQLLGPRARNCYAARTSTLPPAAVTTTVQKEQQEEQEEDCSALIGPRR